MATVEVTADAPAVQLSRDQILQATSDCLHEHGYDATTIRRIAARLGCAVGSIYRYFRDKRELLLAVAQQSLEPVAAMIDAGEPAEAAAVEYHRRAAEAPQTYGLMFWLACLPGEHEPARDAGARRQSVPPVVERIIDGWGRQLGDPALAARCWSLLHGSVMLGSTAEEAGEALRQALASPTMQAGGAPPPPMPRVVITMTERPRPAARPCPPPRPLPPPRRRRLRVRMSVCSDRPSAEKTSRVSQPESAVASSEHGSSSSRPLERPVLLPRSNHATLLACPLPSRSTLPRR